MCHLGVVATTCRHTGHRRPRRHAATEAALWQLVRTLQAFDGPVQSGGFGGAAQGGQVACPRRAQRGAPAAPAAGAPRSHRGRRVGQGETTLPAPVPLPFLRIVTMRPASGPRPVCARFRSPQRQGAPAVARNRTSTPLPAGRGFMALWVKKEDAIFPCALGQTAEDASGMWPFHQLLSCGTRDAAVAAPAVCRQLHALGVGEGRRGAEAAGRDAVAGALEPERRPPGPQEPWGSPGARNRRGRLDGVRGGLSVHAGLGVHGGPGADQRTQDKPAPRPRHARARIL
eukprot:gene18645-biopygen20466